MERAAWGEVQRRIQRSRQSPEELNIPRLQFKDTKARISKLSRAQQILNYLENNPESGIFFTVSSNYNSLLKAIKLAREIEYAARHLDSQKRLNISFFAYPNETKTALVFKPVYHPDKPTSSAV